MNNTAQDIDEFGIVGDDDSAQRLRRDNLFYLLSEIEAALDRAELSQEDVAAVVARLAHLAVKAVE